MNKDFTTLVVGYGNTLRRDDGVGPKVADAVAALKLPRVRCLAVTQLTPELAEPVSQARLVIFVDAAVDVPHEVRLRKLAPADVSQTTAHTSDPRSLLALARDVFGCAPEAWWLTIPAEDFGYGEELSEATAVGFRTALERIQVLMRQTSSA